MKVTEITAARQFVGIAGESVVADAFSAAWNVAAMIQPAFDDENSWTKRPDILVRDANRKFAAGGMKVVSNGSDLEGHAGEIYGSLGFLAEVKIVSPTNVLRFEIIRKGAAQARLAAGGLYGSVLVIDSKAWQGLSGDQRNSVMSELGSAQLLLIDGLNSRAARRYQQVRAAVAGEYRADEQLPPY